MSPLTHLLASWVVATKTTDNLRDRRLVTWAGVVPDLDGFGIFLDIAHGSYKTGKFYYYPEYHHWLTHGLPAALAFSILLAIFGRHHRRVFLLSMLTFHLHLLCDLIGARGPDKNDLWPIFYFGPISQHPMWTWRHQWRLDGWQNFLITLGLFAWCLWMATETGQSFIALFNQRADKVFVETLQKWRSQIFRKRNPQT